MIKTLFLGSNWEALTTLKTLIDDPRFQIVGLITQPDKPVGRSKKVEPTEIKQYAISQSIDVYHTEKDPSRYSEATDRFKPDLIVCKSFGEIIPEEFIKFPKYSTINVHYSLLPKYRGAVPIQKAILEGEKTTGITYVQMVKELDAGGILRQFEMDIREDDTNQTLRQRLVEMTSQTIGDLLMEWVNGEIEVIPQDHSRATFCWQKDISKENAFIDLSTMDPILIERMVRAFIPWPIAWTEYEGRRLKIHKASLENSELDLEPGSFKLSEGKLLVGTIDSTLALRIDQIQPEGKKIMAGAEFARGQRF